MRKLLAKLWIVVTTSAILAVFLFGQNVSAAANRLCEKIANSEPEYDKTTQKFKGCRLIAVEKGSSFHKLGLKKGSIVYPPSVPAGDEALTMELTNSERTSAPSTGSSDEQKAPADKRDASSPLSDVELLENK